MTRTADDPFKCLECGKRKPVTRNDIFCGPCLAPKLGKTWNGKKRIFEGSDVKFEEEHQVVIGE